MTVWRKRLPLSILPTFELALADYESELFFAAFVRPGIENPDVTNALAYRAFTQIRQTLGVAESAELAYDTGADHIHIVAFTKIELATLDAVAKDYRTFGVLATSDAVNDADELARIWKEAPWVIPPWSLRRDDDNYSGPTFREDES